MWARDARRALGDPSTPRPFASASSPPRSGSGGRWRSFPGSRSASSSSRPSATPDADPRLVVVAGRLRGALDAKVYRTSARRHGRAHTGSVGPQLFATISARRRGYAPSRNAIAFARRSRVRTRRSAYVPVTTALVVTKGQRSLIARPNSSRARTWLESSATRSAMKPPVSTKVLTACARMQLPGARTWSDDTFSASECAVPASANSAPYDPAGRRLLCAGGAFASDASSADTTRRRSRAGSRFA